MLERCGQGEPELDLVVLERPGERRAEVCHLGKDDLRLLLVRDVSVERSRDRERAVVRSMPLAQRLHVGQLRQPLERKLTNRLQHEKARSCERLDKARLHERAERFDRRLGDDLRRLERERSRKHRELREQLLQFRREKVVTPFDRAAQGSLAFRRVARSAGEERQPAVESLEQRPRIHRSQACCRKLERKR